MMIDIACVSFYQCQPLALSRKAPKTQSKKPYSAGLLLRRSHKKLLQEGKQGD